MDIEVLITPHSWLQIPTETRNELAKDFGMSRSGTPRCVTELGVTKIESDGYTIEDLRALSVESMTEWLLKYNIKPENNEIHYLLGMCAGMKMRKMTPETPQQNQNETENSLTKAQNVPEQNPNGKPRFCDQCESKGVHHLKSCPKNVLYK